MTAKIITQSRLKEVLHYSPETGIFTWVAPTCKRMKASDIAGTPHNGYTSITVDGRHYFAHRLAFLYMTGSFPLDQADHINHIRSDNRWENLREADYSVNHKNQSLQSNNTSGFMGVVWHKRGHKWGAQIQINGINKYLGRFIAIEDAIAARKAANIEYGFHKNHGKILRPRDH